MSKEEPKKLDRELSYILKEVVKLAVEGYYYKALDLTQKLHPYEKSGEFGGIVEIQSLIHDIDIAKRSHNWDTYKIKLQELDEISKMSEAINAMADLQGLNMGSFYGSKVDKRLKKNGYSL